MIGDKLNDIPHELTYKTIMQRDFPKPLPNYIPKEKKKYSSNDSPFLALTSYQVKSILCFIIFLLKKQFSFAF